VYRSASAQLYRRCKLQCCNTTLSNHASAVTNTVSVRAYTTSSGGGNGGANGSASHAGRTRTTGDYYNQSKEDEEDKVLEEEEFAALRDVDNDEYMPLVYRLAQKADALDADLRRLRYALCERPQFLVDTAPATLSGRPTQMATVLDVLRQQQRQSKDEVEAGGAQAATSAQSQHSKTTSSASSSRSATVETALRASPYSSWCGTSDPVARLLSQHVFWPRSAASASAMHSSELATTEANLDYLRRARALHQLNYYSRLNLTPKRHIWHALYQILWNLLIAAQNACGCVVYGALRGVKEAGVVKGLCTGTLSGIAKGLVFVGYGFILSPVLHLSRGLCNTLYGPLNAFTGKYMFDAMSGRWTRCTVADSHLFRHELQREKRVLRTIGRAEFRRKKMKVEHTWANRMSSMGFSVDMLAERLRAGKKSSTNASGAAAAKPEDRIRNPYEVLQVRRTASANDIKKQYKKLAMVFHPDVAQSHHGESLSPEEKAEAQHKFEEIASAYQILSNPEKRKAYDMGGAQGVHLHEAKYGKFMSRTPAEMVQSIFGGEGFRRLLIGELLRSHWALRYEAQVSVSLHELEELQCIRVRQLALELAAIADVHAQRPTTPYYGGGRASTSSSPENASSAVRPFQRRSASSLSGVSSSLPDYLKSGKPKGGRAGAATSAAARLGGRRGAADGTAAGKGLDDEMHNSIMQELGGDGNGSAAAAASSPSRLGSTTKGADITTNSNTTTAAGLSISSPFILHPGSNEFNCFSRDFEERCDRLVRHLADACFGKQLLYEVGEAYVVNAQRFLGIRPFYASKTLVTRKIFTGIDRVYDAFRDKTRLDKQQVAHKMVAEYFNMEYDSVVADIHVSLRYALQMVLQDAVESEEVRRKRCYAVWLLGEKMMSVGEKWTSRIAKDEDLNAYLQQAANSVATTSKPPAF
jgi:curved DNA-binding protein CbpA